MNRFCPLGALTTVSSDPTRPDVVVVPGPSLPTYLGRALAARGLRALSVPRGSLAGQLRLLDPHFVVIADGALLNQLRMELEKTTRTQAILVADWAPAVARAAVSTGYAWAILDASLDSERMARHILVELNRKLAGGAPARRFDSEEPPSAIRRKPGQELGRITLKKLAGRRPGHEG